MSALVELYFKMLKALMAACLLVMVVLVFGNVVLRYGFNSGITVSEELSRWLFVWLTFLGAIVAVRENGHLGVDILVRRLPLLGRRICLSVSHMLMIYATYLLMTGSWQQTLINWEVVAPATGLSGALFYGVGVLFGVSTIPVLLVGLYRAIFADLDPDDLVMVQDSEEAVPAHVVGDTRR